MDAAADRHSGISVKGEHPIAALFKIARTFISSLMEEINHSEWFHTGCCRPARVEFRKILDPETGPHANYDLHCHIVVDPIYQSYPGKSAL